MDDDFFNQAIYIAMKKFNMSEEDFWNMSPFLFEEMTRIEATVNKEMLSKMKSRG